MIVEKERINSVVYFFQAHLKSHTGEYTFTCSMCPGRYKTMKTLQDHLAAKHGVEEELMEEVVVVKDEEEIMV